MATSPEPHQPDLQVVQPTASTDKHQEIAEGLMQRRLHAKLRRDLGPAVLEALNTEGVEDVVLNPDGRLWAIGGGPKRQIGVLGHSEARAAIGTIANCVGRVITEEHPILETALPLDGSRVEALIPPLVDHPCFVIRRPGRANRELSDLEESGVLTDANDPANQRRHVDSFLEDVRGMSHADVIRAACKERKNIVVCGGTGSGKTSLAKAILRHIDSIFPDDRVLIIEDTPELVCSIPDHVKLLSSVHINMAMCIACALRMAPNRIIIGEIRGPEALAVLTAWNTGHPGGVVTVHANSAEETLPRLEDMVRQALPGVPMQANIARTVDLIVWIDKDSSHPAGRKVKEVCAVLGYENGKYVTEYL